MSGKGTSTTSVEDTLKDLWTTRPERPRHGRKVAGVAAAIGRRYAIDPVIIRVAFVVMTFYGGTGVLAYLVGWLLLRDEGDEVSPAEALISRGRSSSNTGVTVLLCVALIPASSFTFTGQPDSYIGIVLAAGGLFLLHHYRSQLGQPGQATSAPTNVERSPMTSTTEPVAGPTWDPLGAAPSGWELPDPDGSSTTTSTTTSTATNTTATDTSPPSPSWPGRNSVVGPATFGLAMATAGLCALLGQLGNAGTTWFTVPHSIGLVVAVLGLGLLVGAFVGGGRGLIWPIVLLSVLGFVFTVGPFDRWNGIGNRHFTPTSVGDLRRSYDLSIGNANLDLRQVQGTDRISTALNVGVGNTRVRIPRDARVEVTCSASIGRTRCLDEEDSGLSARSSASGGTGRTIVLNVRAGIGNVEVVRD